MRLQNIQVYRLSVLIISISILVSCQIKDGSHSRNPKTGDSIYFPIDKNQLRKKLDIHFKFEESLNEYIEAEINTKNGKYKTALTHLRTANQIEPNNKLINHAIGISFGELEMIDSAKNYTQKSINIDTTFAIALNSYGLHLMNQDSFDKALKYYDRALSLDNDNEFYYMNKAINYCKQLMIGDSCCKYFEVAQMYQTSQTAKYIEEEMKYYKCK